MKFGLFSDDENTPIGRFVDWWMKFMMARLLPLLLMIMIAMMFVGIVLAVVKEIRGPVQ